MEIKFEKLSLGVYSSEHLQKHQEFSEESLLVGNTIRENSSGEEYFEELAKLLGNRTYDLSKNFEFDELLEAYYQSPKTLPNGEYHINGSPYCYSIFKLRNCSNIGAEYSYYTNPTEAMLVGEEQVKNLLESFRGSFTDYKQEILRIHNMFLEACYRQSYHPNISLEQKQELLKRYSSGSTSNSLIGDTLVQAL